MQDFLNNNLGSAAWWISVVVVGILLNLISSYFRDYIDKFLSRVSGWWANRTDEKRKRTGHLVQFLVNDKFNFLNYQFDNLRNWLRLTYIVLLGIV